MDMDEKQYEFPQGQPPQTPPVPEAPAEQRLVPDPPVIEQFSVPERPVMEQPRVPAQPQQQPDAPEPAERSDEPEPAAQSVGAQPTAEDEEAFFFEDTQPTQSGSYVSGTYHFGPAAFARQQDADRVVDPDNSSGYRGFEYSGVRSTVQPACMQAPPVTPQQEQPQKKRHTGVWLALALVLTLALGGVLGALGYRLFAGRSAAEQEKKASAAKPTLPDTTAPTRGKGDVTDRITRGESTDYASPSQIYSDNVDAVVGISNESTTTNIWGQASSTASSGTGFIISEDGYILTNYHVAKGADKLTVTLSSGKRYSAQLIGYENVTCDVALLKIDAEGLPTVKLGDSDVLQVGEQVCTIGNPLGELTYTLTVGYVSAKERAINTDGNPINMLQTDAAINSGNSGGPLFDMAGNVVGIVTAKYSGSSLSGTSVEGLGFAIPISNVLAILDDLQQYGYVTDRAYLGVMVADTANIQNANLPAGVYISSVDPGSCAERAGIQVGDVIVGVGDTVINSYEALVTALNRCRAGETRSVTIFRDGSYLNTEVTFDARPREEQTEQETQSAQSPYSYDFGNPFGFWFP